MNRLKGIGILNSKVLLAAVFTGAFAAAAYAFPEIFGAWFANYLGGAFVLMSVYSLGPGGFSQDAIKATGRAIKEGVIDDAASMQNRFASYFDGVRAAHLADPDNPAWVLDVLEPGAGAQRAIFLVDAPGVRIVLPDRTILDAIVLKQGTGDWGWTHILVHSDQFKALLGSGDPDSIQRWIRNTVEVPDKFKAVPDGMGGVAEYRLARNFGTSADPIWVYVTARADGSITTAYPTHDLAYITNRFA